MDNPYIPDLAAPAFANFVKAEQACDVAWENVKEAKTMADRKTALENYKEVQAQARQARSLYHKCEASVRYEKEEDNA